MGSCAPRHLRSNLRFVAASCEAARGIRKTARSVKSVGKTRCLELEATGLGGEPPLSGSTHFCVPIGVAKSVRRVGVSGLANVPAFNGSSLCSGLLCTSSRAILSVDWPQRRPGVKFDRGSHVSLCRE
jgi:hypothetical protein